MYPYKAGEAEEARRRYGRRLPLAGPLRKFPQGKYRRRTPAAAAPCLKRRAIVNDDPKTELSFVTTDEMLDELSTRYEGVVIAYERQAVPGSHDFTVDYRGGQTYAIGLASRAFTTLSHDAASDTRRVDEDGNEMPGNESDNER